jgi:hypothetical protein
MYMDRQTSPLTAAMDKTGTSCRWCGKTILAPRRNQMFCCKEHRADWTRQQQATNAPPKTDTCPHCGQTFDKVKKTKVFCSTTCQQDFNNHWKAHGPALAIAMHKWRVKRVAGGISDVCHEFSKARETLKEKRHAAHQAKGNAIPVKGVK